MFKGEKNIGLKQLNVRRWEKHWCEAVKCAKVRKTLIWNSQMCKDEKNIGLKQLDMLLYYNISCMEKEKLSSLHVPFFSLRAVTRPIPAWKTSRHICAHTRGRSHIYASSQDAPRLSAMPPTERNTKTALTPMLWVECLCLLLWLFCMTTGNTGL